MHKINLLSYLILLPFFCFSQNNKPADNEGWQTALVELNTYIKEHFDETIEVKGDVIYNYFKKGYLTAKIENLYNVIKLPAYNCVYLTCKDEDRCVYSSYTNYHNPEFKFSCKTAAEMDKTFELLNDFWLKLTSIESKTKHTNDIDNIVPDPQSAKNVKAALNSLNNYIKDSINYSFEVGNNNNTFEIKDGLIIKHLRYGNKLSARIDDLYKVVKIPKRNAVHLVCKDNSKCLYNLELNHYYPASEFNDLKSEAQMDRLFELYSKFWFLLTGNDSKIKYDNATLMKMQERIMHTTAILTDVSESDTTYNYLSNFKEKYIEVYYLDLNYDYESYHGGIKAGDKWCEVQNIKIKLIPNPELDSNTVEYKTAKASKELGSALNDYTTTVTNNQSQNASRDEAVTEMKKLAEKVKEYNQSLKMYQDDCIKDKEYHQQVSYGRSTPCDNIISYNKMIKSAIEKYLEKYQNYITEGDVRHLKQQISNAETNINNAKLK